MLDRVTSGTRGIATALQRAPRPYSRYTIAVMVMLMAKWFPVQAECAAATTGEGDRRGSVTVGVGGPSCLRRSNLLVDGYQYR